MAKKFNNYNSVSYGGIKDLLTMFLLKSVYDTDGDGYIDFERIKSAAATSFGTLTDDTTLSVNLGEVDTELTSLQSQITAINAVSLSANNVFTGSQTFSGGITGEVIFSGNIDVQGDPDNGDGVGNRDYNDGRYAQLSANNTFDGDITVLAGSNVVISSDTDFDFVIPTITAGTPSTTNQIDTVGGRNNAINSAITASEDGTNASGSGLEFYVDGLSQSNLVCTGTYNYTKVGNIVFLRVVCSADSGSLTDSSYITIDAIPAAIRPSVGNKISLSVSSSSGWSTSYPNVGILDSEGSILLISSSGSGTGISSESVSSSSLNIGSSTVTLYGSYLIGTNEV